MSLSSRSRKRGRHSSVKSNHSTDQESDLDYSSSVRHSSINPRSHTPSTLKQFAVAGLADSAPLPSAAIPGFPHRHANNPQSLSIISPFLIQSTVCQNPESKVRRKSKGPLDLEDDAGLTQGYGSSDEYQEDGSDSDQDEDSAHLGSDDDDDDLEKYGNLGVTSLKRSRRSRAPPAGSGSKGACINTLKQAVYQFLDAGQIDRAHRAYAVLLRLVVQDTSRSMQSQSRSQSGGRNDQVLDLRRNGLWAVGMEILAQHGQSHPPRSSSPTQEHRPEHPGSPVPQHSEAIEAMIHAVNIHRVKDLLEILIQQHPWDHRRPKAISSLHFRQVQFSFEVFVAQTQYLGSLRRLGTEPLTSGSESSEESETEPRSDGAREQSQSSSTERDNQDHQNTSKLASWSSNRKSRRLRDKCDRLRHLAIREIRDVATRMDQVMRDMPYSRNAELVRLRGMVSLYISDLLDQDPHDVEERQAELDMAARTFETLSEAQSRIDSSVDKLLSLCIADSNDGDDNNGTAINVNNQSTPVSCLPIRTL